MPENIALFYQGYGQAAVDQTVLAYYRYERIVQDIAAYCQQLLLTDEGGADPGPRPALTTPALLSQRERREKNQLRFAFFAVPLSPFGREG